MAQTHKAAKTNDRVRYATGKLVDDHMIDFTNMFAIGTVHFGPVNIIAGRIDDWDGLSSVPSCSSVSE